MKRYNIYLYEYKNGTKGINVGYCKMDFCNNNVKINLNVNYDLLGINPNRLVDIKAYLLMESGEKLKLSCDRMSICSGRLFRLLENKEQIVGISVTYEKANDIKVRIRGMIEDKEFVEKENDICENRLDKGCAKIKEDIIEGENKNIDKGMVKLNLEELTSLPREYWRLCKNKFFLCGCNRYGHFGYIKQGEKYVICVPGIMEDKYAVCARKFGFKTYFCADTKGDEKEVPGYWMMGK